MRAKGKKHSKALKTPQGNFGDKVSYAGVPAVIIKSMD